KYPVLQCRPWCCRIDPDDGHGCRSGQSGAPKMNRLALTAAVITTLVAPVQAESMILPSEWTSYVENYVAEDGRVIDTANNGISHSESQGYGLVLSALADDQPTFERIWTFTSTQLMVRDDGLASWLWDASK